MHGHGGSAEKGEVLGEILLRGCVWLYMCAFHVHPFPSGAMALQAVEYVS